MDWGLISFRRNKVGGWPLSYYFRPRLLIPPYYHFLATAINLVLRFAWTATMVSVTVASLLPERFPLLVTLFSLFFLQHPLTLSPNPHLQVPALAHLDSATLVLLVETAEVLRRAMWNVFRVEWQIIATQVSRYARCDYSAIPPSSYVLPVVFLTPNTCSPLGC